MDGFVEWVASGVARIRVPNPAGLARNVYLIEGSPCALVDGGHVHAASQQILLRGLATLGHGPADIGTLFLTDITPDRVGAVLHPAYARARVVAHPAGAGHADYARFAAALRAGLLAPLRRDRRLGARLQGRAFGEVLELAYGGAGVLRVDVPAPLGGHVGVGNRRFVPVAVAGVAHEHVGYRLEPEGLFFSGDLPGATVEMPALMGWRGAEPRRLVADLRRLDGPGCQLPAVGPAAAHGAQARANFARVVVQARDRLAGLLCGGSRELATLVSLWSFGRALGPLAFVRETATVLALAADLATQGVVEEAAGEGVIAFRLAPRAWAPVRRTAA